MENYASRLQALSHPEEQQLFRYVEKNLKRGYIRASTASSTVKMIWVPKKGKLRMHWADSTFPKIQHPFIIAFVCLRNHEQMILLSLPFCIAPTGKTYYHIIVVYRLNLMAISATFTLSVATAPVIK